LLSSFFISKNKGGKAMEINRERHEEVEVTGTFGEALKDLREAFEPIARAFREVLERIAKFLQEK